MADFTFQRVIDIMRRVLGKRNQTDALSTDNELIAYAGEYIRDLMPQEIRNFENFGTYYFSTQANIEYYTFNTSSGTSATVGNGLSLDNYFYESVGPIAYCDENIMNWFQDPALFHAKWGFDTGVASPQTGQPFDILLYEDMFHVKPIPDDAYTIRIFGFKRNIDYTAISSASDIQAASGDPIPENYWGRMIAYGASLDYMYDFAYDPNRIAVVENRYKHYKALVHNHTLNQVRNQTPLQRW